MWIWGSKIHWWQGEGLNAAFIGRFSLDWESEHAGCEGWWWGTDGKCGQQEKLIFLWGCSIYLAPADGCQLAVKTVARSSELLEDGNPDFFLMGNLLFLKCHVGQTKHDCGPHSAYGLPLWNLWFIVLAEHDVSVPICNPEACSFQTQSGSLYFAFLLHSFIIDTHVWCPPQDDTFFGWHSLHLFQFAIFSVVFYWTVNRATLSQCWLDKCLLIQAQS